ncbi:hypothetical protein RYX36_026527 [Vicia faba]
MVSGENDAGVGFNALQHGDAEMSQKLYRLVRACIELGDKNPIVIIHDQGAGGNCNVVKEIIYPKDAEIDMRAIVVGDHTMFVIEIWGAEYKEHDAILVKPESHELLKSICKMERVSMAVIETISGDGRVVLVDSLATQKCLSNGLPPRPPAVDLELEKVLGDMPHKSFEFNRIVYEREPLDISPGVIVISSLKRTFTDITGGACAIGEQPIKGLLDPKAMARLAVREALTNLVWAKKLYRLVRACIELGDKNPIVSIHDHGASGNYNVVKEIIYPKDAEIDIREIVVRDHTMSVLEIWDPNSMARLAVGDALTNLVWEKVTSLSDVKASGNWMYAAKLDVEGASIYDVVISLSEEMF